MALEKRRKLPYYTMFYGTIFKLSVTRATFTRISILCMVYNGYTKSIKNSSDRVRKKMEASSNDNSIKENKCDAGVSATVISV